MNHLGTEVLDHGDDPGRYTVIYSNGRVLTCNENGSIICQRRCVNPTYLVLGLTREDGIRTLSPKLVPALLKKINLLLHPDHHDD